MSLASMWLKIDVSQDTFAGGNACDSRVSEKLRSILPTWMSDICRDVIKYDLGLKINREAFKYFFQHVHFKMGYCA